MKLKNKIILSILIFILGIQSYGLIHSTNVHAYVSLNVIGNNQMNALHNQESYDRAFGTSSFSFRHGAPISINNGDNNFHIEKHQRKSRTRHYRVASNHRHKIHYSYHALLKLSDFHYDKSNNVINEKYSSPYNHKAVLPKHFHLRNGMHWLGLNPKHGYTYRYGRWYIYHQPTHLIDSRKYYSHYRRSNNKYLLKKSGYKFTSYLGEIDSKYPPFSRKSIIPKGINPKKYDWWDFGKPWSKKNPGVYEYHHHKWLCTNAN